MTGLSIISAASGAGVPQNTARPTITGAVTVGQTLTVSTGTWSPTPSQYFYQWYSKGAKISGATAASYTVQSTDYTSPALNNIYATVSARNLVTTSATITAAEVGPVRLADIPIQYLVVAGGGGGGYDNKNGAGGGGAGGLLTGTFCYARGTTLEITVGAGGAGGYYSGGAHEPATNGGYSRLAGSCGIIDKYAYGGGSGGGGGWGASGGGSGGGGSWRVCGSAGAGGGAIVPGQGKNGGSSTVNGRPGAGGGGAGCAGQNSAARSAQCKPAVKFAGNGGNGLQVDIAGVNGWYAGGGGGSSGYYCGGYSGFSGCGGCGCGGAGGGITQSCTAQRGASGTAGTPNSGSGGGAGIATAATVCSYSGGAGGAGTVIIDYASPTILFTTTGQNFAGSYCRSGTRRQFIRWRTGSGTASAS